VHLPQAARGRRGRRTKRRERPREPIHKPADYELILRVVPMPADVNANGDIFGGWLTSQVDIAGGASASRRKGRRATASGGRP
jgi:acyl-CoA hydrolase